MSRPPFDLVRQRLLRHGLLRHRLDPRSVGPSLPSFETPGEVVRSLGAVQAQDYLGALWAIGLRLRNARECDVERALAEKTIVRTWPMRGTLHFVAATDVRWMLDLLTPAVVGRSARRVAELGLGDADFLRSRKAIVRALEGGRSRTRKGMYAVIEGAKVSTAGQRGIHILWQLAQEGLIAFGPREGREQTFVLLDEWLPATKPVSRDEARAEIASRYFAGHGPATLADFIWWSGLPAPKAREALDGVKAQLGREVVGDQTYWFADRGSTSARPPARPRAHLLPAFDEYLVGYKDRAAVMDDAVAVTAGGGMLAPTLVVNGRVIGTWRRTFRGGAVVIAMRPFRRLKNADAAELGRVAETYGEFVGKSVAVEDLQPET